MKHWMCLLMVSTLLGCPSTTPELCDNGLDDDENGQVDCADVACVIFPACVSPSGEVCNNGVDDDSNGQTDCEDGACAMEQSCLTPELCNNGVEDDGDGLVDCDDPDCSQDVACQASLPESVCDDGMDDDGDGLVDCEDPDCALSCGSAICEGGSVHEGDVSLGADAGVLSDVRWLQGDLVVEPDVTVLPALPDLRCVTGDIVVRGTGLTDLVGLEALTVVDGALQVEGNESLQTLQGLSSLTYLRDTGDACADVIGECATNKGVYLRDNPELRDLSGLSSLQSVEGDFFLTYQGGVRSRLTSIQDLERLREIQGTLVLEGTRLSGFYGFAGLQAVGGLRVVANAEFVDLGGLTNVMMAGREVVIRDNGRLTDFTGLEDVDMRRLRRLEVVGNDRLRTLKGLGTFDIVGSLEVRDNAELQDLDGLETLREAKLFIRVESNPDLTDTSGLGGLEAVGTDVLTLSTFPATRSAYSLYLRGNEALRDLELPFLTTLHGDLILEDHAVLRSLSGISALQEIGGTLQILDAPALTSLAGLEALTMLGRGMELRRLGLTSLQALSSLTDVGAIGRSGAVVQMESLPGLVTLEGLESMRYVGFGRLDLMDLPLLESLSALDFAQRTNITNMSIVQTPRLVNLGNLGAHPELSILRLEGTGVQDLDGLEGLAQMGQLYLVSNLALEDVDGLSGLSQLARLEIRNNPSLMSLVGLAGLSTVTNWLKITGNGALSNLEGLHNLVTVGVEARPVTESILVLDDNAALETWGLELLEAVHGGMQVTNHPLLRICLIYETHRDLETRAMTPLEAPPNNDPVCPMTIGG